jgi:uncharacterized protein YihD (DUF1040 family)
MQSGFVKRAKRTMQNVERGFLNKMVQKMLNRYCQFDPDRFPSDFKFRVYASMGIMAREVEQAVYVQLLQTCPPEDPMRPLIMKEIVSNSSAGKRNSLIEALEKASQPDPAQQQMQMQLAQAQQETMLLEMEKIKAEIMEIQARTQNYMATAQYTGVKSDLEDEKIEIMAAQTVISNKKLDQEHVHKTQEHQHKKQEMEHKKTELRAKVVDGHENRKQKTESDKTKAASAANKAKAKPKKV